MKRARTGSLAPILLLIAWCGRVAAQNCFKLAGSQSCPGLQDFFVQKVPDFQDVNSFDAYIKTQSDGNPDYVNGFKSQFGCPNWDGLGQRYHISTLCFYLVQFGRCQENPPIQPLCRTQCNQFIASMNTIFQNGTACPPQVDAGLTAARTNIAQPSTSPFAAYCATLNDNSGCKSGLDTELVTCGFSTAAQVAPYCSANGSDPCCAKAAEATDATLKTIAKGLAPVNNTPWIASGIALGAMVFFALVFIFCIKMKPWKKASTSASEPPPSEIEPGPLRADTLKNGAGTGPFGSKRRTSLFSAVRQSIMGFGGRSKVAPPPLPVNSYPTMKSAMQSVYSNPAPPQSMYTDAPPPPSMYNAPPPITNAYSVYSAAPPPILPPINNTPTQPLVQMKVVEAYAAQLGDELSLMIGDVVTVEEEYDDGWGVGRNESTGEIGAFPVTCLEPLDYSVDGERPKSVIRERTKSLYASGFRN